MMTDWEFAQLHSGTPEETNIYGSANPTTVGGHVDTASRRIVSNIGLEDMSGVWWTWLQDRQSYITGTIYTITFEFGYEDISGTRGSHYGQGTYPAQAAVVAGGDWTGAANCGSRARDAHYRRSYAGSNIGCRAVAEPQ
jgi:formylglycine-generating enzyme required for sulfatase activity